jgi:hypothetical protein
VNGSLIVQPKFTDNGGGKGLEAGIYFYRVTAVSLAGLESSPTAEVSAEVGKVSLSLPTMNGKAGSTVTIPVGTVHGEGMAGMEIIVGFDTSVLSPLGMELTNLTAGWLFDPNVQIGQFRILLVAPPGVSLSSEAGSLVNLKFAVNPDAPEGVITDLTFEKVEMSDSVAELMNVSATDGSFTVSETYFSGDANGDGILNIQDAVRLLNFTLGLGSPTDLERSAMESNGDGEVNYKDIINFLKLLSSAPKRDDSGATRALQKTVSITNYLANPGEEFVASVKVYNRSGIAGGSITLGYDPNILTVLDVRRGDAITGFTVFGTDPSLFPDNSGRITIDFANSSETVLSSPGSLAEVRFRVVGGLPSDVLGSPLTVLSAGLSDERTGDLGVLVRSGSVTVPSVVFGGGETSSVVVPWTMTNLGGGDPQTTVSVSVHPGVVGEVVPVLYYFDAVDRSVWSVQVGPSRGAHGVWQFTGSEWVGFLRSVYGRESGVVRGSVKVCLDVNCGGSVSGLSGWGATFFAGGGGNISGFPLTTEKTHGLGTSRSVVVPWTMTNLGGGDPQTTVAVSVHPDVTGVVTPRLYYFDMVDPSVTGVRVGPSLSANGVWQVTGSEWVGFLREVYGKGEGVVKGSARVCVDEACSGSVGDLSAWGATFFAGAGNISGFPLTTEKTHELDASSRSVVVPWTMTNLGGGDPQTTVAVSVHPDVSGVVRPRLFYFDMVDPSVTGVRVGPSLSANGVWQVTGSEWVGFLRGIYGSTGGVVKGSVKVCVDDSCSGSVGDVSAWGATFFAGKGNISGFPLTTEKAGGGSSRGTSDLQNDKPSPEPPTPDPTPSTTPVPHPLPTPTNS